MDSVSPVLTATALVSGKGYTQNRHFSTDRQNMSQAITLTTPTPVSSSVQIRSGRLVCKRVKYDENLFIYYLFIYTAFR